MVLAMFSCHNMNLFTPINHRLSITPYLNIVATVVYAFMATIYPSPNGYFQHDNAPCHKAKDISNRFDVHDNKFSVLQFPSQSPDLKPIEHIQDVAEWVV